jgi:hypothetical protein
VIAFAQTELALMQSPAASHAKTFLEPETVLGSLARDRDFGLNTLASLASFDLSTSSWRTSQLSLNGEWTLFAETWPASGMMRNGHLFQHVPLVRHTCDSECSLWPTPTASMDGRGFGIPMHDKTGRYKQSTVTRVQELVRENGWRIHPNFTEALMDFPMGWTEIEGSETPSRQRSRKLSAARSSKPSADNPKSTLNTDVTNDKVD